MLIGNLIQLGGFFMSRSTSQPAESLQLWLTTVVGAIVFCAGFRRAVKPQ